ncbi:MAG: hypothetical protein KF736_08485 [Acidobacteria bacterium]|nr:hypothetical protein [Acidobacteriota bacterium]MCW5950088.1 hypothetical protein [Pyrinomonadaceae bacterium]
MISLFAQVLILFAGGGHGSSGGFTQFYNDYLNIPGFEAWKFFNLFVFVGLLVYLLKRPLGDAFKARRETIRAELIKAEEEKQAAMARLVEAEAKVAQLENEKQRIIAEAKAESEAEQARVADQTSADIDRLRQQADSDLARIAAQTRAELRRFSAEESVRLAEEKLRGRIDAGTDVRLVKASIDEIGGLN